MAALVTVKLTSAHARPVATESPASLAIVRQVSSVPAAMLTGLSPGQAITPLQMVKTYPQIPAGLSAAQIASQLSRPSSPVARAIDGAAKVIIAAIERS
jgi:hypothetical protein